jgi:hypothetical protein
MTSTATRTCSPTPSSSASRRASGSCRRAWFPVIPSGAKDPSLARRRDPSLRSG